MNFDPVSMPKVELHCHLDGSLSKEFLMQTLQLSTLDMHTIQAVSYTHLTLPTT